MTVTDSSDPSHADPVRAAAEQRRGEMAVIWLLYAEAAACDPGEARGHFYGRAGCAELSQFLTLAVLVLAATSGAPRWSSLASFVLSAAYCATSMVRA